MSAQIERREGPGMNVGEAICEALGVGPEEMRTIRSFDIRVDAGARPELCTTTLGCAHDKTPHVHPATGELATETRCRMLTIDELRAIGHALAGTE
jgi:hypothetical protein